MTESSILSPVIEMGTEALRCPYPYFDKVRDESPAWWSEELGVFVVTRYADIVEIVRNPEVFSSQLPTGPQAAAKIMESMLDAIQSSDELRELVAGSGTYTRAAVLLGADPPAHSSQRRLVNRAFGPPRVAATEPKIREIATDLVDRFIDDGRVELVKQFAVGLPLTVIADALGVEREGLATFKRWSDDMLAPLGNSAVTPADFEAMARSQIEFDTYFRDKIEQRRKEPQDDLISDVVHSKLDGEELSVDEMLGMFGQFLVAGNETTTKLITSGMLLLLENPEAMEAVRSDHSLIGGLVEEVLRLEPPVQGLYRAAKVNTEVGGVQVPAGSHLWMLYAAGNRDPGQFEDPNAFDVCRRNANTHLSFGQGPHYCLGASLARSEGRIAFETLLTRLDDIALEDPNSVLEYEPSYVLHGLKELRLTFTAGTRD